ncbi:MAG: amidase [Pseudomonadota bacterium]
MVSELWQYGVVELAAGLRANQFSAVEVLQSVLARMDACNPALNAIVEDLREPALQRAEVLDQLAHQGQWQGPLHGIPVTSKINVDQMGLSTNNGLPALAGHRATADAPVVKLLQDAGGVVFGRSNAPELSMRATTDNPLYGRTGNPWDEQASPGGSSGGAGSAAAAGMGPLHHGNDIGGSLRFPAYACGVTSLKPTNGRIPAYNPSATSERGMLAQLMSVQGVICRQVADLHHTLPALFAEDPRDPWWVPVPFAPEDAAGTALPAVAISDVSYGYPLHAEVRQALERARSALEQAGYTVTEVEIPSMQEAALGWMRHAVFEIQHTLGATAAELGSTDLQNIFAWYNELGPVADMSGYVDGLAERTALTRRWNELLSEFPLVLTPYLLRPTYAWDYDAQGPEQTRDLFESAVYSTGVNYLSLPAGVLPVGFAQGLPTGVQLIGKRYREDLILRAMQAVEDQVGTLTAQLWAR